MLINPLFLMQHILYSLYFAIFVLTCLTVCLIDICCFNDLFISMSRILPQPFHFWHILKSVHILKSMKIVENFVPFKMLIFVRVHTNSTWVEARIRVIWQLFSMRIPLIPFLKSMSDLGSTWLGLQRTIFQFICMWRRWYDLCS